VGESVGFCESLSFAEFVFVRWQTMVKFQELENQAGKEREITSTKLEILNKSQITIFQT